MNITEQKAFIWLKEKYCLTDNQIVYQYNKNPDFITPYGNFEVKPLSGKRVYFTRNQIKDMTGDKPYKILLFIDDNNEPLVLTYEEVKQKFSTYTNEGTPLGMLQIKVSQTLINKAIRKLKLNPNTPANYVVDNVLRIYTE